MIMILAQDVALGFNNGKGEEGRGRGRLEGGISGGGRLGGEGEETTLCCSRSSSWISPSSQVVRGS